MKIEGLVRLRDGGDDRSAVGPPGRRDDPRLRVGRDGAHRFRRGVDDHDVGWRPEPMTFDGDADGRRATIAAH